MSDRAIWNRASSSRTLRRQRRVRAIAGALVPLFLFGPEQVWALHQQAVARRAMGDALAAAVLAQSPSETTWSYSYDGNGNLVYRHDGSAGTLYHYDAENRLRKIESVADVSSPSPQGVVEYEYDADGVRRSKKDLPTGTVGGPSP